MFVTEASVVGKLDAAAAAGAGGPEPGSADTTDGSVVGKSAGAAAELPSADLAGKGGVVLRATVFCSSSIVVCWVSMRALRAAISC